MQLHPLNHEQRELAEDAAGMADSIARRWQRLHPRYADEIHESAMIGAIAAAESFEPEKEGAIWHRWVKLKVEVKIRNALHTARAQATYSLAHDELEAIQDHRASDAHDDDCESATRLLSRLPTPHKALCNLVYREGMDTTSASHILGFSSSYGCRLHREAITLLREIAAA